MSRAKMTVSTVVALLVLGGCSSADDRGDSSPSETTGLPSASGALPSVAPSTAAPTGIVPRGGTSSPSGGLSLVESCRAVVEDQKAGLAALRAFLENPVDPQIDVQDIDRLRSELRATELSAPGPLRQELRTQVEVLASLAESMRDGKFQMVDVRAFEDASARINALCAPPGP